MRCYRTHKQLLFFLLTDPSTWKNRADSLWCWSENEASTTSVTLEPLLQTLLPAILERNYREDVRVISVLAIAVQHYSRPMSWVVVAFRPTWAVI